MSLQELSDRAELQQLVVEYAYAIDERDWDRLDRVFTADAYIDYRAMGGIDGRYPQVKAWLAEVLAKFPAFMHLTGNLSFDIRGDGATGKVACFNPMVLPGAEPHTMFLGLWYLDRYVRTPAGWRMAERVERRSYDFNVPDAMKQRVK